LRERLKTKKITAATPQSQAIVTETLVIDRTNKEKIFSLDEIIKKIPAKLGAEGVIIENEDKADLIIILGSDIIDTYRFEEDSAEDYANSEEDENYFQAITNSIEKEVKTKKKK
jgi:polysaccharide pyruvyl transferase WcaK-like protein